MEYLTENRILTYEQVLQMYNEGLSIHLVDTKRGFFQKMFGPKDKAIYDPDFKKIYLYPQNNPNEFDLKISLLYGLSQARNNLINEYSPESQKQTEYDALLTYRRNKDIIPQIEKLYNIELKK